MIISSSFAADATTAAASTEAFSFASFVPLILIFLVFYFLIIRPQLKKAKQHQALVSGIKVGDKVVTSSGIFGVVKEIHSSGNTVDLEIASGVKIKIYKSFVSEVREAKEKDDQNKTKELNNA